MSNNQIASPQHIKDKDREIDRHSSREVDRERQQQRESDRDREREHREKERERDRGERDRERERETKEMRERRVSKDVTSVDRERDIVMEEKRSSLRRNEKEKDMTTHNGNAHTGSSITNISNSKIARSANNSPCLNNLIFPLLSEVRIYLQKSISI